MALRTSQMAGGNIRIEDLLAITKSLGEDAILLQVYLERDLPFHEVVPVVSRLELHLGALKSAFSVMALRCIMDGVDFTSATHREPPTILKEDGDASPASSSGDPDNSQD